MILKELKKLESGNGFKVGRLNLSGIFFSTTADVKQFVDWFANHKHIKEISLKGCKIGEHETVLENAITNTLKVDFPNTVSCLVLASSQTNGFRVTKIDVLSNFFKQCPDQFECIDLSNNHLTIKESIILIQSITSYQKKLRSFDFSLNAVDDSCLSKISDYLKQDGCSLKYLNLQRCMVASSCTHFDLSNISDALRVNTSLRVLDLTGCKVKATDIMGLDVAIKFNTTIVDVFYNNEEIDADVVTSLNEKLEGNRIARKAIHDNLLLPNRLIEQALSAVRNDNYDWLDKLLGVSRKLESSRSEITDTNEHERLLHLLKQTSLPTDLKRELEEVCSKLIQINISPYELVEGKTLLFHAFIDNRVNSFKLMLERGASILAQDNAHNSVFLELMRRPKQLATYELVRIHIKQLLETAWQKLTLQEQEKLNDHKKALEDYLSIFDAMNPTTPNFRQMHSRAFPLNAKILRDPSSATLDYPQDIPLLAQALFGLLRIAEAAISNKLKYDANNISQQVQEFLLPFEIRILNFTLTQMKSKLAEASQLFSPSTSPQETKLPGLLDASDAEEVSVESLAVKPEPRTLAFFFSFFWNSLPKRSDTTSSASPQQGEEKSKQQNSFF